MIVFYYIAYILIGLFTITFITFMLSKIRVLSFLKIVASYTFGLSILVGFLFALWYYGYLLISLSLSVFDISRNILDDFVVVELATYLALFIDLVFIAYFVEYLGYALLNLFEKFKSNKSYKMSKGFRSFVRMIRPKMFLYLFATIFTVIASIENIIANPIITHDEWNSIKPFLFEATISFIALDGFISMLMDHKGEFIRDIRKNGANLITGYFGNLMVTETDEVDQGELPE